MSTATIERRHFTVTVRGQMKTFASPFTDDEALDRIRNVNSDFARDLVLKAAQGLSRAQWAWVHKIAVDAEKPAPVGVEVSLKGVVDLFDAASEHLKRPKIRLMVGDQPLALGLCGAMSRYQGCINVTDGRGFENGTWFGRIDRDGNFTPGREVNDLVRDILRQLAAEPARTAAEYGKLTGNCCFCGRPLSDERSTEVGYGKICAEHFHLPWG